MTKAKLKQSNAEIMPGVYDLKTLEHELESYKKQLESYQTLVEKLELKIEAIKKAEGKND